MLAYLLALVRALLHSRSARAVERARREILDAPTDREATLRALDCHISTLGSVGDSGAVLRARAEALDERLGSR